MKIKNQLTTYLLIALTIVFALSCGQNTNSVSDEHEHAEGMEHDNDTMGDMDHEHDKGEGHNMEEMDQEHEHEGGETEIGEAFTWIPTEESMDMLMYKTDNVMMMKHGEDQVLMFTAKDNNESCMFKSKHSNVGFTVTIKMENTQATVKLIHHSTGRENFEFVMLEGGVMKLGRVENGEEKIFDSKEVEVPADWFTLTVTAAGTHYKGYINDKMITHGHGDVMEAGLLGIVVGGSGVTSVKKVDVTPLEAEH